jgi:hypothetical protein
VIGFTGMLGVLPDGGGQGFHRRGGLFQRAGLQFGTRGQVDVAGSDFTRSGADGFGAAAHLADDTDQAVTHFIHLGQQAAAFGGAGVDGDRQVAVGDAAGDPGGVVRLAAELLDQAAGDDPGGSHADRHCQHQHHQHEVTGVHEAFLGILLALGALLVFQGNELVQRFGPLLLDRAHFLDHHTGRVHGVVGQVQLGRLGNGRHRGRFVLLHFSQQRLFVIAAGRAEDAGDFLLRLVILGGLVLEALEFRLHVGGVGHQGQHAQRRQAVGHVVAHLDHGAARDVVDTHHMIEPVLDLRHAQDADHGHHNQQHQHQGETQSQAHPDFHLR